MEKLPTPFPDPELWNTTLEEGFRKFPERRNNYNKFKASTRKDTLDYLPIQLDIENVSRCNYSCIMCQVGRWPGSARAADMSFDDYKSLINSQPGLIEVKIQGMGEPFMGTSFIDMIDYARKKNIWVRSSTNASLLHLEDNYKKVLDADICELQVSVDGASKESYEKIRRGGRFETVRKNCILLNSYGAAIGKKRTRMWTIVQHDNFQELENFPGFSLELGFDRLTLSMNLNFWGRRDYWDKTNEKLGVHKQFDTARAERLIELGRKHGVEVTFWFTYEKYDTSDLKKLCPMPFQRLYITSDMRLACCGGISDPKIFNLGDARRITEEWNGKKMVGFRKRHINGDVLQFCRPCYK